MAADEKPMKSFLYNTNMAAADDTYSPDAVRQILSNKMKRLQEGFENSDDKLHDYMEQGKNVNEAVAGKNEALRELSSARRQQELYGKNPELYSQLYAIQENSKEYKFDENDNLVEDGRVKTAIAENDKGEMCLLVRMQMEGSPFSFALRDGKVTFPTGEMSPDQLKEVMDFLWRRGISDFELPKSVDPQLAESFEKAKEEFDNENHFKEGDTPQPTWVNGEPENENGERGNEEAGQQDDVNAPAPQENGENAPGANGQEAPQEQSAPAPAPAPAQEKFNAEESVEKWLSNDKGKKKGLSFFKEKSILGGGWTEFRVYDKENADNLKLDGKRDKKGFANNTYAYVLYTKKRKDGTYDFGYAMPNGKQVTDAVVDKIIGMNKDQGRKKINIGGLPEDDTPKFMENCGKKLMIPTGIGLDARKIKTIMRKAEDRGSEDELLQYKYDLVQQMVDNEIAKAKKKDPNYGQNGEDPMDLLKEMNRKFAEDVIDEYSYKGFKEGFNLGLRKVMSEAANGREADAYIASARATRQIYDAYAANPEGRVSAAFGDIDLAAGLEAYYREVKPGVSAEEQQKNKNMLKKITDPNNPTKMKSLTPQEMMVLAHCLMPKHKKEAETELKAALDANSAIQDKDQRETSKNVIKGLTDEAQTLVQDIADYEMEPRNLKMQRAPRISNPKFKDSENDNGNGNSNDIRPERDAGNQGSSADLRPARPSFANTPSGGR